jgi:hypothetical protein
VLEGERARDGPSLDAILLARHLDLGGVGEGARLVLGTPDPQRGLLGAELRHRGPVLLDRVGHAPEEERHRRPGRAREPTRDLLGLHVGRDDERDGGGRDEDDGAPPRREEADRERRQRAAHDAAGGERGRGAAAEGEVAEGGDREGEHRVRRGRQGGDPRGSALEQPQGGGAERDG